MSCLEEGSFLSFGVSGLAVGDFLQNQPDEPPDPLLSCTPVVQPLLVGTGGATTSRGST